MTPSSLEYSEIRLGIRDERVVHFDGRRSRPRAALNWQLEGLAGDHDI